MGIEEEQEEREEQEADDEDLRMELRNPSDALHILARSGESSSQKDPSARPSASEIQSKGNRPGHASGSGPAHPASGTHAAGQGASDPNYEIPSNMVLDDYELVRRGLLHPSVLPELLHMLVANVPSEPS